MSALVERLMKQSDDLDRLFSRVASMDLRRCFGERYQAVHGNIQFTQGSLLAQTLVFNIPKGNDFRAQRISFLPFIRLASPQPSTQGPTERTFRPTSFTVQPGAELYRQSVDLTIELLLGDIALQSAPFCVSQTFSGAMPTRAPSYGAIADDGVPFDTFEIPSASLFSLDMAAGEALTARVTPMFTAAVDATIVDDGRIYEYQVVGLLEGAKVLK